MHILSKNLKRFRLAKGMTQEQAAEALGVSTQTVSRWECETTLPDAVILPRIARLYCVTIDDLYKETSVAYPNFASRLFSVFEASRKPEDFIRAEEEYQKLLKTGEYTTEDLRSYAILHQFMMSVCMEKAEELFDRVIRKGPEPDREVYWSTRRQKVYFLSQIGRNQETIDEFLPLVEGGSLELQDWVCLIQAYSAADAYDTAWEWAQRAQTQFPESAMLHIYIGDLLRAMKRYDEAFPHWKRALEMEPDWLAAAFSMGFCYEELGDYASAYAVWKGVVDNLERRGFELELDFPRSLAQKCKEKLQDEPNREQ